MSERERGVNWSKRWRNEIEHANIKETRKKGTLIAIVTSKACTNQEKRRSESVKQLKKKED